MVEPQLTDAAIRVLQAARETAVADGYDYARAQHLLIALATVPGYGQDCLVAHNATADRIWSAYQQVETEDYKYYELRPVHRLAINRLRKLKHARIDTGHLLLGILEWPKGYAPVILTRLKTDVPSLDAATVRSLPDPEFPLFEAFAKFRDTSRIHQLCTEHTSLKAAFKTAARARDVDRMQIARDNAHAVMRTIEVELAAMWRERG